MSSLRPILLLKSFMNVLDCRLRQTKVNKTLQTAPQIRICANAAACLTPLKTLPSPYCVTAPIGRCVKNVGIPLSGSELLGKPMSEVLE